MMFRLRRLSLGALLAVTEAALLGPGIAQAENFNGYWIGTGYTCGPTQEPGELVNVFVEGANYVIVKLHGDACVTSGSVTVFGRTSASTPLCEVVTGSTDAPNSGIEVCPSPLTITNGNEFTVGGLTFTRMMLGQQSGITLESVSCRNLTTGGVVATGTVYNPDPDSPGSWSCDKLSVHPGDVISESIVGRAR